MIQLGIRNVALGVLVVLTVSEPTQAQVLRGGFDYPILRNKSLQQEIKLSGEQAKKVDRIVEETARKSREELQAIPKADRPQKRDELYQSANADATAAIKDVLKPEQQKRLNQVLFQQCALSVFTDREVQEKLNLTSGQKTALRELNEGMQSKLQEVFGQFSGDRRAGMPKLAAIRKEALEKALAVLNDDQKAIWKDLTGEPFEIVFEGQRPGAGN